MFYIKKNLIKRFFLISFAPVLLREKGIFLKNNAYYWCVKGALKKVCCNFLFAASNLFFNILSAHADVFLTVFSPKARFGVKKNYIFYN